VLQVLLGGQFLNGVSGVRITGEGAQGTIVQYGKPFTPKQLMELRKQVKVLLKARRAGNDGLTLASLLADSEAFVLSKTVPLPEHPLLRNLDKMGLKELEYWAALYSDARKRQINPQIAEMVLAEITIAPGAAPGWRELRLVTPAGLTNPLNFCVGTVPEIRETEPNDKEVSLAPADLPVVLNGQIFPGDRDRFSVKAKRGQKLVMKVEARRLIPYLADAVPGWFQATLAVHDAAGKEVAFADDYRFDPDPVLLYEIPADGEYTVEIHDALYRGGFHLQDHGGGTALCHANLSVGRTIG
jgi:hypothetical protein